MNQLWLCWFVCVLVGLEGGDAVDLANVTVFFNLPSNFSFTNTKSITYDGSSYPKITSVLPTFLGELDSLEELVLDNNLIFGELPEEISSLTALRKISLSRNHLNGTLPSNWSSLTALESLDLSSNFLSGTLPSQWAALTSLKELNLGNNTFLGGIPTEWGWMTALRSINLGDNLLNGTLPVLSPTLTSLGLQRNNLTGNVTKSFHPYPGLLWLDLSSNHFFGSLLSIGNLSLLQYLALDNNQFSGFIPSALFSSGSLVELRLRSNNLSGMLGEVLPRHLSLLDLSGNVQLSGPLPNWNSSTLMVMNLSHTSVSGLTIDTLITWNTGFPALQVVDLSNTQLIGAMPRFSRSLSLKSINYNSTKFFGEIPIEWNLMTNLSDIWLPNTIKGGCFPSCLTSLKTCKGGVIPCNCSHTCTRNSMDICSNAIPSISPCCGVGSLFMPDCVRDGGVMHMPSMDIPQGQQFIANQRIFVNGPMKLWGGARLLLQAKMTVNSSFYFSYSSYTEIYIESAKKRSTNVTTNTIEITGSIYFGGTLNITAPSNQTSFQDLITYSSIENSSTFSLVVVNNEVVSECRQAYTGTAFSIQDSCGGTSVLGVIAGAVVGSVVLGVAVFGIGYCLYSRRREQKEIRRLSVLSPNTENTP